MSIPDNWKVSVVICPVCDEPVIADVALASTEPGERPVMIRHHVERQAAASGRRGLLLFHCKGSKALVPAGHAIDPLVLQRRAATARPDIEIELHRNQRATITTTKT